MSLQIDTNSSLLNDISEIISKSAKFDPFFCIELNLSGDHFVIDAFIDNVEKTNFASPVTMFLSLIRV